MDLSFCFSFATATELLTVDLDGLGGDVEADHETVNVSINGAYHSTLLDGDADAATQALYANAIIGDPIGGDIFPNLGISLTPADTVCFVAQDVGGNNGFRLAALVMIPELVAQPWLLITVLLGFRHLRGRGR